MFSSDLLELMPHTITHRTFAARDAYGKAVFSGSGTSYRARVSYETKRTVSRVSGQDALANGVVWIAGTPTLKLDDEITLPDGTTPPIINWEMISDENGPHHVKVYFGGTQSGQQV